MCLLFLFHEQINTSETKEYLLISSSHFLKERVIFLLITQFRLLVLIHFTVQKN